MGDFRVSRTPATPPRLQFPTFSLTRAHWLLHVVIHMGLCRQRGALMHRHSAQPW